MPPLPDRKPAHVEAARCFPAISRPCRGPTPRSPPPRPQCDTALKDVAIDYEPLPPIKEGICGAPAPILVKSIGSDPKVAIDPPATMTCALAAGLAVVAEGQGAARGKGRARHARW